MTTPERPIGEGRWTSPMTVYSGVARVSVDGGSATWRVTDPDGGEWVLRTVGLLTFEDTAELDRFEREAAALARAVHPAIPRVREVFRTPTDWCLVTTAVSGQTLRECVASTAITRGALVEELLRQGLDALDALHGLPEPVVHRGITLDRLRVAETADGPVLSLVGFGEARVGAGSGFSTVGSLDALAPEQAMGRAEARSDLYALGLCLLALATHQPLHALSDPTGRGRRLRALTGLSPRALAVLDAMLRPELSRRLVSARVGLDVLQGKAPLTAVADPERPRSRLPRWARRTLGAMSAVGLALACLWAYQQRLAPGQIDTLGGWFTGHGAPFRLLSKDRPLRVAYASSGRRLASLGTRDEVLVWDTADASILDRLNGDRRLRNLRDVALSPDGVTLALCGQGGVALMGVPGGEDLPVGAAATPCYAVDHGGELVALVGAPGAPLSVIAPSSGAALRRFPARPGTPTAAAVSQDGRLAVAAFTVARVGGRYGEGSDVLLSTPDKTRVVPMDEWVFEAAVAADGRLAAVCLHADAVVLAADTGEVVGRFAGAKVAALSRDGRRAALALNGERTADRPVVSVRELESGRELATFSGHARSVRDLSFSPDGQTLLTASRDGLLMRWRVP